MTDRGVVKPTPDEIANHHDPRDTHISELLNDPIGKEIIKRFYYSTDNIITDFDWPEDMEIPSKYTEKNLHEEGPPSPSTERDVTGVREPIDVFDDLREGCLVVAKEATDKIGFNEEFTTEDLINASQVVSSEYAAGTVSDYLRELSEEANVLAKDKDGRSNVFKVVKPWWKQ